MSDSEDDEALGKQRKWGGGDTGSRRGGQEAYTTDVVDLKLQHDGVLASGDEVRGVSGRVGE